MKKKLQMFLCIVLFGWCIPGTSMGLDMLSVSDNLFIESIDAIRIINAPKPVLRVIATFKNSSERDIRIKSGYFNLSIVPNTSGLDDGIIKYLGGETEVQPTRVLHLGQAKMGTGNKELSYYVSELNYFEINAVSSKPGILEIMLPMGEPDRNLLINRLINYIGLPGSFESISMQGKVTLGFGGKRGWAYQDLSLLELHYEPSLQEQVLFK